MLPFSQAIRLPIDIYYGVRFDSLKGKIKIRSGTIRRSMIRLGSQGSDIFERNKCVLSVRGMIVFNGSCVFGTGCSLVVRDGAILNIGDDVCFGARNFVYCSESITVGGGMLSSWDCQFMDSNTHDVVDVVTGSFSAQSASISIGEHCWFGNRTVVNKGVRVPANTIISSCSLLTKNHTADEEFCLMAGIPAKVIKRKVKWVK